jgi:hypothetical protein
MKRREGYRKKNIKKTSLNRKDPRKLTYCVLEFFYYIDARERLGSLSLSLSLSNENNKPTKFKVLNLTENRFKL